MSTEQTSTRIQSATDEQQRPIGPTPSGGCLRNIETGSGRYGTWERRLLARLRTADGTDNFIHQAPEIQTMYSVPHPVSAIRSRMRQEFERHRYVNKLPVVDVLVFQSQADYQVSSDPGLAGRS